MTFLHRCLLFAVLLIHSCPPPLINAQYLLDTMLSTGPRDPIVKSLATAIYRFTTDLHKILIESDVSKNVICSPTSIYVALAMLYPGSGGETKSQLASVLHLEVFESDDAEFYRSIKTLLQTMNSAKKRYTLKMATRLFGQKGLAFKDEFLGNTKDYFRAELEALDFSKDPSGSRSKINSWVSKMTSGKIKELFDKNSISSGTVLTLANAVYFNASWRHKFYEEETKPQKFSLSEDQSIQVPMMHLTQFDGLRYTSSNIKQFRLLELPYTDKNVSMIIALDDGKDHFDSFLNRKLIGGLWGQIVQVTTKVAVEVSMPKFSLQQDIDLKKPLVALGLENLFENANLSGIVDSVPLKLSKALHKANVAVGELGTEAAAATGFLGEGAIYFKDKIIEFTVDREFLFFVVEKPTASILFFGHIKNPLKSN